MKLIETEIYKKTNLHAFTQSGFRAFFLGAAILSVSSIFVWFLSYGYEIGSIDSLTHAHEMIYGYVIAIIAGFLLTAIRTWTNMQTVDGWQLMIIFGFWTIARILGFINGLEIFQLVFDSLFLLTLTIALGIPILRRKQMGNIPIIGVIIILFIGNSIYHFGKIKGELSIQSFAIYFGFYTLFGLILMFIRRLVPNFLDHGLKQGTKIVNYRFVDLAYIPLFVLFAATKLSNYPNISNIFASLLFILGFIRLGGWYSGEIWRKSLLWSLFLSYLIIVISFGIYALSSFIHISQFLPLHGLAMGGAGIITLSMMARVALGHTGRSIMNPPKMLGFMLGLLVFAVVSRVFLPLVLPQFTRELVLTGMIFWIISFTIFIVSYTKILITKRPDGLYG